MRIFSWFGCVLLILMVCYAPTARAQEDLVQSQIDIDLESGIEPTNATVVNAMDESTYALEQDVILAELPEIEGKYYGPYQQSSLFQFSHKDNWFQFVTNFTVPSSAIMNGVSEFWLRVPIVSSQYEWWHVWSDWGYADTLEIESDNPIFYALLTLISTIDPGIDLLWFPWLLDDWTHYLYGYDNCPNNFWSPASGDTYDIIQRDTGLYIKFQGIFKPDEQFWVMFTGKLINGQKPQVYLTSEKYSDETNQTFKFYNPYIDFGQGVWGFKYQLNETLPIYPAWSFLFVSGLGKDGMTSYVLRFDDSDDYLQYNFYLTEFDNMSYLSIYMPFSVLNYKDIPVGDHDITMDWNITMTLWQGLGGISDYFNTTGEPITITFAVTDTTDFLLCSSPYDVVFTDGYAGSEVMGIITIRPLIPATICLLGAEHQGEWHTNYFMDNYTFYYHEDQQASWNASKSVNAHLLPLFRNVHESQGRWAEITETKLYWIYDFGWGTGYYFPGETSIYMFLDNGGQYFYNGSYASFLKDTKDNRTFWEKLIGAILKPILTVIGWIWDGLMKVYDTLKNIGSWIVSSVLKIVGWIVSVVKDIAGKVSSIVEGMLYGMPMLAILFLVNYVGTALYRGKLPRLTKERGLLRKLRPRRILKQRTKIQRKLKYPIIRAKAGIGAIRRERLAVTRWRTERSRAKAEGYERKMKASTKRRFEHEENAARTYRRIGRP